MLMLLNVMYCIAKKSSIGRQRNGGEDVLEGTYSRYRSPDANLSVHIGKAFMHILLWLVETVFDQISSIDFAVRKSLLLYVY